MKKVFILLAIVFTVSSCSKAEQEPEPICILQKCVATLPGYSSNGSSIECPNMTTRCNRLCDTHKGR